MERLQYFLKFSRKILIIYLIQLFIFQLFRLALLISFGNYNELIQLKLDILEAFWVGFKFDTCVIFYGLIPVFFLFLIFFVIPYKSLISYAKSVLLFSRIYLKVIFFVLFFILIVDFYFFKFFQTHFSQLVFGIKNDDTWAVLVSVWTDYPIIRIFLLIAIFNIVYGKLLNRILFKNINLNLNNRFKGIVISTLIILMFLIGLRGSLGAFPLRGGDTSVSSNTFVNRLVFNGVFALKNAYSKSEEFNEVDVDIEKMLEYNGFENVESAIVSYTNTVINEGDNPQEELIKTTPRNQFLDENPPHVVFVLMESMSNHYLDIHSEKTNLLGKLDDQLDDCYVFRNFLSATNVTIHTLENILIGSPKTPISQSKYFSVSLSTSVAKPFKDAYYNTSFITGAKLGWRNVGDFLSRQFFDEVRGYGYLMEKYENAEYFEWGVHDEFLFNDIFDKLSNSNKPEFIFALTVSNHTPFYLPEEFVPESIELSDEIMKKIRVSKSMALKNFKSYQYANNLLGEFIEKVKNSPFADNTIIVATGDHNTHQIFNYTDRELFLKNSVPFILYVPEKYRPSHKVNLNRFGSHKDIFPTIFNLSLSKKNYLYTGENLLENEINNTFNFGINSYTFSANQFGAIFKAEKPIYFKWEKDDVYNDLVLTSLGKSPELNELQLKVRAYIASMNYMVQTELLEKSKDKDKYTLINE